MLVLKFVQTLPKFQIKLYNLAIQEPGTSGIFENKSTKKKEKEKEKETNIC